MRIKPHIAPPATRLYCLALAVLIATMPAQAKPTAQVKTAIERAENTNTAGQTLILPFAFSAESTGFVAGVGGMRRGFYQDQMTIAGAAYGGQDSYGGFVGVWDYRPPFSQRTFLSVTGMIGYYPRHRAYSAPLDSTIPPSAIRPGSNASSEDAFIEAAGDSNWWDIKLEYVLPLGSARDNAVLTQQLENGLLASNSNRKGGWNPAQSGTTVFALRQYNRYQSYKGERGEVDGALHAFEFGLLYDNTDFNANPSEGSSQYIAVHHDPAWLESKEKWTFVEMEASKYFSLGASRWARQRIIALNAWTAYSPSWKLNYDETGASQVSNRPPFMEGASLGGFYRMRGYRDSRFSDKAAIYATAEYRYTVDYNPIRNIRWLQFLHLDWFQVVAFAEGGRVAPAYNAPNLFRDWKGDWGVGLRALTAGIVVRMDVATSPEGTNLWVMVGHPF